MKNKNEWFHFHYRIWLEDIKVFRMSLAAQGLYMRALCYQARHGNIPADTGELDLLLNVRDVDSDTWKQVFTHFQSEEVNGEQRLYNQKLRDILIVREEVRQSKAANRKGKTKDRSNNKRKTNDNHSKKKPSTKPSISNSYSPSVSKEDFKTFYALYPKKKSPKAAHAAWLKHVNSHEQAQQIISHVQDRAAKDPDWLKDGGEFIPHPATFLNNARWEDHYSAAHPSAQKPRKFQTEGERRNAEMQQHTDPKSRKLSPEEAEAARREDDEFWNNFDYGDTQQ